MIIHSTNQLKKYQAITKISTDILRQLYDAVKIGVTPLEIDALAEKLCKQNNVKPNFKGQGSPNNPYKYTTCIAVNEAVVHGIPNDRLLESGDIVKVDFGIEKDNLNTDHCFTVGMGKLSKEDKNLIEVGRKAVLNAVDLAVAGNKVGDLGFAMESTAEQAGYTVAKQYVGHGIGATLHEEPQIPSWGNSGEGAALKEGMVICVEAQVIAGDNLLEIGSDGWTVRTKDGSKAAMFEYMVVVGKKKPLVLTETRDWGLVV